MRISGTILTEVNVIFPKSEAEADNIDREIALDNIDREQKEHNQ